ncbi:hypothetical protein [Vallitalea maricola]|uniref:Uncharacterized protein n=1 Tax=Vallitalea maricola TaxID=3074433 RepID=A0ACB5ULV7_9FIRM|nr:hypothetical protein AN2V17_27520 [Vallitalea sp. AN17-2]
MAIKTKTIYFYQLHFSKDTHKIKPDGTPLTTAISTSYFKDEFINILNNEMNNNTFQFGDTDQTYSLELIKWGKNINSINNTSSPAIDNKINYFFGKLGKKKDIIDFQKRKITTLKSTKITKADDEFFEVFTYFYMFFEDNNNNPTITLAFMKSQSAPDIRKLSLLSRKMTDPDYIIDVTPIIAKNGIDLIIKKDIVNSITYKISLPPDNLLDLDALGLSEKEFEEISELKSIDYEFTLKGKRSKNILNDKNILKKIFNKTKSYSLKKNGMSDELIACCRNEDEDMTKYNFLDNKFISKVTIDIANVSYWDDEVRLKMHEKYMKIRRVLLNHVR